MSSDSIKTWILEAIDQLRQRKARPDTARICHMVKRRHGVNSTVIQTELERMVNEESVIKVDYKGKTSYRNAARWQLRRHQIGNVLNSDDVSQALIGAIRQATSTRPAGATVKEIEQALISMDTKLKNETLNVYLQREVNSGAVRFSGDLFRLPAADSKKPTQQPGPSKQPITPKQQQVSPTVIKQAVPIPKQSTTDAVKQATTPLTKQIPPSFKQTTTTLSPSIKQESNAVTTNSNNLKKRGRPNKAESPIPVNKHDTKTRSASNKNTRGRPISKRKRIKKTHGPDFVETSSIPSLDSDMEDLDEVCDLCFLGASCNPRGLPEKLISCRECDIKAHPSCVKNCNPGIHVSGTTWLCLDCRNGGDQISEPAEEKNKSAKISKASTPYATPCDSPISEALSPSPPAEESPMEVDLERVLKNYPDVVPDAQDWTVDDVERFFLEVGFPEHASNFKEQEIDGKSLMLLKRSDVLNGLNLRLGPALKIYNHVLRLQTGIPDGYMLPAWSLAF